MECFRFLCGSLDLPRRVFSLTTIILTTLIPLERERMRAGRKNEYKTHKLSNKNDKLAWPS